MKTIKFEYVSVVAIVAIVVMVETVLHSQVYTSIGLIEAVMRVL
jgi:hypothetical protein